MVLLRRSAVLAILLVGFVGTLTVEARSHHLSRRNTETAEGNANEADDDYAAFGDEAYNNDDVLNDDSQNYDEDDDDRDAEGGENEELEPSILLTKSTNFTIPQRGKVWLPCEVTNAENAVIIWKKDQTILFQNEARFTKNPRIYRYSNFTISITDLESSDLGLYTCSVVGSQGNPSIAAHRVSFPQPPHVVLMLPEGNARLVPEGRPLKVECRVRGDPQPTISWSRKGQRLTKDDVEFGNQFIYIKNVRRQDSGMYQCLASNNVGQPAYGAVDIKVLHVPEVHVKKSVVNTDEGYEAHMLCTVKSEPRATIVWERNGVVLKDSQHHHITLDQNGDHSKLRILSVTPNDFGKYECKANNAYGSGEGHVNLVRHPGRALWISGAQEADSSPVLQWAVESVQPITDAELRYYKVDESKPDRVATEEEWIVVKPDITQPNGNVYTVKHVLQGLRPGKYAARLRSKNTHGWSELSEQHMFDGDYETNEVLNNEILVEAPVAEVGSSAINNKYSSFATAATLLLSMISYSLVRIM